MLRCTLILSMLLGIGGCYNPSPPAGAYRCATLGDGGSDVCPSSQHCTCGLCVKSDSEAPCAFALDAKQKGVDPTVNEHQPFPVTITARTKANTTASDFSGTVSLSFVLSNHSAWCDVSPSTVQLKNGTATAMVTLNRETIPPQAPQLAASFYGNIGLSGPVTVRAPDFSRDTAPVVGPVNAINGFGWANSSIVEPDVTYVDGNYRMYFSGSNTLGTKIGIGVATSSDGAHFTAQANPLLTTAPGSFYAVSVGSPGVFYNGASYVMAFSGSGQAGITPPAQIGLALSHDGLSPFTIGNQAMPALKPTSCDYCGDSVDTPSFVTGANLGVGDGGVANTRLMFFSAINKSAAAIGLATSADNGATWVAAPSAVLNGDVGGEAILLSPHVLLDGTVYKMWYSFARLSDYLALKNEQICDLPVYIGYATSSDTYYWVRSPRNVTSPAVGFGSGTGKTWDAGYLTFLAGSAIPTNGKDASAGISLYYSALHHAVIGDLSSKCVADAIGRATRP